MIRLLLALVCLAFFGVSAQAGPFGIFGNRQQSCSGGECQSQQQFAPQQQFQQFSAFPQQQFSAFPQQFLPPVVTQVAPVTQVTSKKAKTKKAVANDSPEILLITSTNPPPVKIVYNGIDYFPSH